MLAKPPIIASSWGIPKIDLGGCVLYLPLWRPDMGGSPIVSKDIYAHSCTVTGAVWGSQGRWFDKLNDMISVPVHTSTTLTTAITIIAWINSGDVDSRSSIVHKEQNYLLGIRIATVKKLGAYLWGVTGASILESTTDLVNSTWYHTALVYDSAGGGGKLFLNGVSDGTAAWSGVFTYGINNVIGIGNRVAYESAYPFSNLIGEAFIYNRALTLAEIQNIYLSTKWRYR